MGQVTETRSMGGQAVQVTVQVDDAVLAAQANQRTVGDRLDQALANMQQIIDATDLPAGTLTAAQLSTAARQLQTAVKAQARLLKNLVRQARSTFDQVD